MYPSGNVSRAEPTSAGKRKASAADVAAPTDRIVRLRLKGTPQLPPPKRGRAAATPAAAKRRRRS